MPPTTSTPPQDPDSNIDNPKSNIQNQPSSHRSFSLTHPGDLTHHHYFAYAIVFLITIFITATTLFLVYKPFNLPHTPTNPLQTKSTDYYTSLANQCAADSCCLQSVSIMEQGEYQLATTSRCAEGFQLNQLRCSTSLKWCQPDNNLTTPDPTSSWKTYTNQELGYSLQYPDTTFVRIECPNQELVLKLRKPEDDLVITNDPKFCTPINQFTGLVVKTVNDAANMYLPQPKDGISISSQQIPFDTGEWSETTVVQTDNTQPSLIPSLSGELRIATVLNLEQQKYHQVFYSDTQYIDMYQRILSTFKFINPTDSDTSNWQTYSNQEFGFQFKYPSDWHPIQGFKSINETRFLPIDVRPTQPIGDLEGNEILLITINEIDKSFDSYVLERVTTLGNTFPEYEFERFSVNDYQGFKENNGFIFINFDNDKLIHFNPISEEGKENIDQILSTFTLLDTSPNTTTRDDAYCTTTADCRISNCCRPTNLENWDPQICAVVCSGELACINNRCILQ